MIYGLHCQLTLHVRPTEHQRLKGTCQSLHGFLYYRTHQTYITNGHGVMNNLYFSYYSVEN